MARGLVAKGWVGSIQEKTRDWGEKGAVVCGCRAMCWRIREGLADRFARGMEGAAVFLYYYDSGPLRELLAAQQVEVVIPPRRNRR